MSVLSQTGPSTRARAESRPPSRRRPARPSEVRADDPVVRPVQRGADELGHAGVEHDDPLGVRPLPDVEHGRDEPAGARDEEPAGLDREPRGHAVRRQGREQRLDLAGEAGRRRHRPRIADREAAADVERVEARPARPDDREQREAAPDGVAPRVDRAELRPDVEVDAARAERPVLGQARDGARQLGLGHPELRAAVADGQPRVRLRGHVRVEPEQDVERRPPVPAEPGARGERRERVELLGALDRDPARRVAGGRGPDRGPQVAPRPCRSPRA